MSAQRFTERLNEVIRGAREVALAMGHEFVTPEHFLAALLGEGDGVASAVLSAMSLDREALVKRLASRLRPLDNGAASSTKRGENPVEYTARARKVLNLAQGEADNMRHAHVGTEHLLLGILLERGVASDLVREEGGSLSLAREQVSKLAGVGSDQSRFAPLGPMDEEEVGEGERGDEGGASPNAFEERGVVGQGIGSSALSRFCTDLTALARSGVLDPVVGREGEVGRMEEILSRRTKNNPVLVGEAGVGKTAVVEGLAQRIVKGDVAPALRGRRILSLSLTTLIGGTNLRGQFEERLGALISEAQAAKDVILFIDEMHTLVGAGAGEGTMDAVNILKPALARGGLQCIGATTRKEYRLYIEKDPALERRFQPVQVSAPNEEEAMLILLGLRAQYESFHGVRVPDSVVEYAVRMSERYVADRNLPDKAIDLMDEACARVVIAASRDGYVPGMDGRVPVVEECDVAEVLGAWTGIPVTKLTREEEGRLLHLEEALGERVVGQEVAVRVVSQAIRRARAGLADPERPLGSFLFAGPTGVGKTELARALNDVLFSGGDSLIRVDMSELMEKHSVSRLIGAPPGYVGYEEGGLLTEAVRTRPYSVVLLDEIEKAHPDVYNVLLQVLDDGRLTDGQGREVSFRNCVIIMTTNLGAEEMRAKADVGFHASAGAGREMRSGAEERMIETLEEGLRPEFYNRIDDIVVFHPLTVPQVAQIAHVLLKNVVRRVEDAGMSLEMRDSAMELLVEKGYDVRYGARPLKRAIQRLVVNPLSESLLRGEFRRGERVVGERVGDGLRFSGLRGGGVGTGGEAWTSAGGVVGVAR